jgi:hypothetical protein
MGVTEDRRKFKIKKKQTFPTNPKGNQKINNKEIDLNRKTIKESQTKE